MIYNNKQQKLDNEKTINQLTAQISSLGDTVNNIKPSTNNPTAEETIEYKELTSSLNNKDILFITKVIKNTDNTYTLYGVVYKCTS